MQEYSRRDFLSTTASGTLIASFLDSHAFAATSHTIDDALNIFDRTGPEYGGGLSNHGPMAAEAIFTLGRPKAAMEWAEKYKSRLQTKPDANNPIVRTEWREALGDIARLGDWIVFFERELTEASWQDVIRRWVPELSPALMAAATHGTIRTSHAVRSLSKEETPQRVHELAQGLGYWAARYQVLPGVPSGKDAGFTPREAIEQVERTYRPNMKRGLLFEGVKTLDNEPEFADDIDLISTSGDPTEFISALTRTFAELYLTNDYSVAFVHSVTAPSALRILVPYLDDSDVRHLMRCGWQACAALYARYGNTVRRPEIDTASASYHPDELIDRALANGDEHTIKLTEVCLREYAINPEPVYLFAALQATK